MIDFEKLLTRYWAQCSRLALMFSTGFYVRCACICFESERVPNPWIIDAPWYFATMSGALGIIPIILLIQLYFDHRNKEDGK